MSTRRSTRASSRRKSALEEENESEVTPTPSQSHSLVADEKIDTDLNLVAQSRFNSTNETIQETLTQTVVGNTLEGMDIKTMKNESKRESVGGGGAGRVFKPLVQRVQGAVRLVDLARTPEGSSLTVVGLLAFLLALAATLAFHIDPLAVPPAGMSSQAMEAGPKLTAQLQALNTKLVAVESSLSQMARAEDVQALRGVVNGLEERVAAQELKADKMKEQSKSMQQSQSEAVTSFLSDHSAKLDQSLQDHASKLQAQVAEQKAEWSSALKDSMADQESQFSIKMEMWTVQANEVQGLGETELTRWRSEREAEDQRRREEDSKRQQDANEQQKQIQSLLTLHRSDLPDIASMVGKQVRSEMDSLLADLTHLPDFALASGGGRVVAHSPVHWTQANSPHLRICQFLSTLGLSSCVHPNADKWLLTSKMVEMPGECLALRRDSTSPKDSEFGFVEVKLRTTILPSHLTLRHIHPDIAFNVSSAPGEMEVQGWLGSSGAGASMVDLGRVRYSAAEAKEGGGPVQTFKLTQQAGGQQSLVDHIRIKILSNHGHQDYTCLYRFHIHGTPHSLID